MVKIDKSLVYLKSENARISLKELSKVLRQSPQRLKYSLNVLIKEKIINQHYCIFDYSYFGLILFRVYYRGAYVSEEDKEKVIDHLKANPYVVGIYELTGEYDLTVEFACPNPSKFNKEFKSLSSKVSTLNDSKVILNLVTYICPRSYLVKRADLAAKHREIIIGGDRDLDQFSSQEMRLLKNLLQNPTGWNTKIASGSRMSIITAKKIWKDLENREVIRGFKCLIDHNALDIFKFRLFLRLHTVNLEREDELLSTLLKAKEVVQINKTVGDWSLEIDLESFDRTQIRFLILKLRESYKDLIERSNLLEFYNFYRREYLPAYLFTSLKVSKKARL